MTQPTPAHSDSQPGPTGDPRPLLLRAADQAVRLVEQLQPAQLELPTPCSEFDLRSLVGHVLSVLRRITVVATGGSALDVPAVTTDVPDDRLAAVVAQDRQRLAQVWADDEVLDRLLTLPWARLPGRAAALAYTQELTVHAWDLAAASGRTGQLDDQLAVAVLPVARQFLPAEPRGGPVPFGPVVPVAADAGPYAQLAGWLGRDPAWTPPPAAS